MASKERPYHKPLPHRPTAYLIGEGLLGKVRRCLTQTLLSG